jgi:hypothetical protein
VHRARIARDRVVAGVKGRYGETHSRAGGRR